jgi:TatD DNase family protein
VRLVDSHCHLQADRFDADLELVIGGARVAGVERILVPGWDPESCAGALGVVDRYPWVDAAVGVHPHDAATVDDVAWGAIAALASDERVVAVGETGLDFDRVFSPVAAQLENLRRNLRLALDVGKPAILHCRSAAGRHDAQDALVAEVLAAGLGGGAGRASFGGRPPAVIHSYSGRPDFAARVLDMGLAISFSGLVFRAGEEASAEVAASVPADRLLVETDSPFLSPPGAPKRRNEPEWVAVTARWLAERRPDDHEALGAGLVAAYDATFPRTARPT